MSDFSSLGGRLISDTPQPNNNTDEFFASIGGRELKGAATPEDEYSLARKAAVGGKHFAAGAVGGLPDTLGAFYNLLAQATNQVHQIPENERTPEQRAMLVPNPMTGYEPLPPNSPLVGSLTGKVKSAIDEKTEGYTHTPESMKHLAEGAEWVGSTLGSGLIGKGLSAAGNVGKVLAAPFRAIGSTKPSELIGAGAAGTAASALQDTDMNAATQMLLSMLTGAAATRGASAAGTAGKTAGQSIGKLLTGKERLDDAVIGRMLSVRAKPNEAAIKEAKKEGIDLPFNVALNSDVGHFIDNNVLKSIFTRTRYREGKEKADAQLIGHIKQRINDIHPTKMTKEDVSDLYQKELRNVEKEASKKTEALYTDAEKHLSPKDKVKPAHSAEALETLRKQFTADVPSADQKFGLSRVQEIQKKWGLSPKINSLNADLGPGALKQVSEEFKKNPPEIELERLIQQKKALMQDIDYGENAKGIKGSLRLLIGAIEKDIQSSSNRKFIGSRRKADDHFREEVAKKLRGDLANSLLHEENPKLAYAYMSSPKGIANLEGLLGNSPHAKEIMGALKRAKLEEVLSDQVFNTDRKLSHARFAALFDKKSNQQGLLKSLLGEKIYNDLKGKTEISQAYLAAGKEFANPSGTSISTKEYGKLDILAALLTGAGSIKGAIAAIGTPYVLSHLLSNPRYTDAAVKFALARQQKKFSSAAIQQKRMKSIIQKTLAMQAAQEARTSGREESSEKE